jgi:hypothetical protein
VSKEIFAPVLVLALWSFVMLFWLYATRIPAMKKFAIKPDARAGRDEFHGQFPPQVRWKSDNYTNLMEQPTVFYAVALSLALLNEGSGLNLGLAWAYTGLRVAHGIVQASVNIVLLRFALFMAASLVLLVMTVRAIIAVL